VFMPYLCVFQEGRPARECPLPGVPRSQEHVGRTTVRHEDTRISAGGPRVAVNLQGVTGGFG